MARSADHIDALDGARGLAILVVMISHGAVKGVLPSVLGNGLGQMGVILFFGLSGFLMGFLYLFLPATGPQIRSYVVHRVARVFPLFYLSIALACASLYLFGYELHQISNLQDAMMNALLLKGTDILWTIPVEIHYYIVFIFLWLARSRGHLLTAIIVVIALQALLAAVGFMSRHVPELEPARIALRAGTLVKWLHIFLAGTLMAVFYPRIRALAQREDLRKPLILISWLVLIVGLLTPPELRRMMGVPVLPNYLDPITAGYPLLLLFFVLLGLGPFVLFRAGLLRWYGKISYSIYLIHIPLLTPIAHLVQEGRLPHLPAYALFFATTTLVAYLSQRFIERPARDAVRRACLPPRG